MTRPSLRGIIHDCPRCHMLPGSDTAREAGCLCPVLDNGHGHIDPRWTAVTDICPLHGWSAGVSAVAVDGGGDSA